MASGACFRADSARSPEFCSPRRWAAVRAIAGAASCDSSSRRDLCHFSSTWTGQVFSVPPCCCRVPRGSPCGHPAGVIDPSSTLRSVTYAELRALPLSRREIDAAQRDGRLVRLRRGRYAAADTDVDVLTAARLGARLDCVSLLRLCGVFTHHPPGLHVQVATNAGRLPPFGSSVTAHWRPSQSAAGQLVTGIIEALVQAVRCQDPRSAVASLDSAWHLDLIDEDALAEIFDRLPDRYRPLRRLLDKRSESGPETLVRLLLRALGCRIDLQVFIEGVGRVDMLVDGWLIVECDSKAFHSSWDAQRNDRRRDLAAATRGYVTLRLLAEDILYRRDAVVGALRGVVHSRARMTQVRLRGKSRTGPTECRTPELCT